ncbi:MAG TPA: HD domain-containing phosphohydrolase [Gemmataceae bacterium]
MYSACALSAHVLVVEDEPAIAAMLAALLKKNGYRVSYAVDGYEALDRLAQEPPDLILLDLGLPLLDGYEVCRHIKQDLRTRFVPVVILTAQDPIETRMRVWDVGADEFISKPIQSVELLARCQALLRSKRLTDELETAQSVLFALARAVEAKSAYTHGHAERVTAYALLLADEIHLERGRREILRQGALLHDIGKISIPDAILDKPGALTVEEYEVVKQHTVQGARIVEPLRSLRETVPLIRSHHERLDGKGYPDGLRGDEISLLVRILAVVDVYDALSSLRPYRAAIPLPACLSILRESAAGGGLDRELVEHFASVLDANGFPEQDPTAARPGPENEAECMTGIAALGQR